MQGVITMNDEEKQILNEVIVALQSKGYDPYGQIYGYVKTGNELYITSKDNARTKIKKLDIADIEQFLKVNMNLQRYALQSRLNKLN